MTTLRHELEPGHYATLIAEDGSTIPVFLSDDDEGVRVLEDPKSSHAYTIFVSVHTRRDLERLGSGDAFDQALLRVSELLFR